MRQRRWEMGVWVLALGAWAVLSCANVWLAEVNQDEGWYLYAAREVSSGRVPYQDFAFTQGPVLPYVYGALHGLWGRAGVLGGRVVTAGFGLLAALGAAWLAGRGSGMKGEGRRQAALVGFLVCAVNVYQSQYTAVVKTYALAGALAMGALCAAGVSWGGRRRGAWAFGAGLLAALAAGTRVSAAGVGLALLGGYVWRRAREGQGGWGWFVAGGAAGAMAVFGPFLLMGPQGLWFGLVGYHGGRDAGGVLSALVWKAGFVSRVTQAYFVGMGCAIGAAMWRGWHGEEQRAEGDEGRDKGDEGRGGGAGTLRAVCWWAVGLVTCIHLAAPFPYDDYQAMIFPVFAACAGWGVALACGGGSGGWRVTGAVWLACMAAACSSPVNQDWFVRGRDRIWWRLREKPSLEQLREAGARIRAMAEEAGSDELLTQDIYLALEAGLRVPAGLELGPFSYYPDWPGDRARACRVVNKERLRDILRMSEAPVAAFSGYGLAIRAPEVAELGEAEREELWGLVEHRYEDAWAMEHFGQASTRLRVMRRRAADGITGEGEG